MTVHAAIYLRISEDRTGNHLGVDRQRQDCAAICEARGWSYSEYCDNDVSATSHKIRPEYTRMVEDIEQGRVQALVVWDLDRLTRKPVETEQIIDLADRKRLLLASVDRDIDLSTDNGRLFARIKGAVARAEVERKSERQRRAFEQRASAGQISSAVRAFGYDRDQVVNDTEAPYVREMFQRFVDGASVSSIRTWLNNQNIPTTLGNAWAPASVRAVLRNPRYCGLRGVQRLVPGTRSGTRDPYHEVIGKGTWEALVPEETWRTAVRILKDPSRRTTPGGTRKHLLSGIARCHCGEKLYVGAATRKDGPVPMLICPKNQHLCRVMGPIQQYVIDALLLRLGRSDAMSLIQRPQTPQGPIDVTAVSTRLDAARARLTDLASDYGTGVLSRAEFMAAREATQAVMAECEQMLSRASGPSPAGRFLARGLPVGEAWQELDLEGQRALLDEVLSVVVHPGRTGRVPFDPATVAITLKGQSS